MSFLSAPPDVVAALCAIPGVRRRHGGVEAPGDCAAIVARILGVEPPVVLRPSRALAVEPDAVRGWSRLFPWQREAALALATDTVRLCWHATGLGKTPTGLVALDLVGARRAIVVTRAIGRESWVRDSAWAGDRSVAVLVGTGNLPSARSAAKRADRLFDAYRAKGARCLATADLAATADCGLVVVGWEVLADRIEDLVLGDALDLAREPRPFDALVFDEHHMGKGRTAARATAARRLAEAVHARGGRVWGMTATPVRDRLRDLYAQLSAVAPAAWGSSWTWVHRYCHAKPSEHGGLDTSGPHPIGQCTTCRETTAELTERLEWWVHARTRDELRDRLPAWTRTIRRIPYDARRARAASPDGGSTVEARIARAAAGKIDAVVDAAVEVLIGDGKVVVVGNRLSWVPRAIAAIERSVAKVRRVRDRLWLRAATGEVAAPDRVALAREYMDRPGPAALVATIDAVSESIDLHDTDALVVAALPYTPGAVVQLEGRVVRLGQRRPVAILYLVAEGTIDVEIERLLLSKLSAVADAGADTVGVGTFGGAGPTAEEVTRGLDEWLRAQGHADHTEGAEGSWATT